MQNLYPVLHKQPNYSNGSFTLNATETAPSVDFNPETGKLIIEGNSIPNDAEEFFNPILSWLEEYVSSTRVKTTLVIKLHYFNVSSSKEFYMFYKLNELLKFNKPVVIKWYYSGMKMKCSKLVKILHSWLIYISLYRIQSSPRFFSITQ